MTAVLTPAGESTATASAATRTRWEWPALAALLLGTAVLYLVDLSATGWGNAFYAAAAQAGSQSWKAFFFGSSDAANSITVDKPPASLWLMALSVRAFGLNSWSILVPQALLGVGSVALLWATVRRYFGATAGLLSGLVLALTPVAALMFRFDNPDALLVLVMIAAAWAMLRAVETGGTRWLVATGALVGLGFLTKQLQVMLVVPALALTYLIAGPPALGKRILQLFAAGAALVVAAGWWVLAVELWPKSSRPYIGGSQNNSILELTLGYNGFGRLSGNERGSVTPGNMAELTRPGGPLAGFDLPAGGPGRGGPGGGMWGSAGIGRLFDPAQGGQIAWLIPAALILGVLGIVLCGKSVRTDARRASFLLWGLWLVGTGLVFSYMAGIFHPYYTVALAPAVAALVGSGSVLAWRNRSRWWVRATLAVTLAATAIMAWILLGRSSDFVPWLRWVVAVVAVLAAVSVLLPATTARRWAAVPIVAALFVCLAGPTAYALDTASSPHAGGIVSAGPNVGGFGFGGRGGPGGRNGDRFGFQPGGAAQRGAHQPGMPGMPGLGVPARPGPGGMPEGMGMFGGAGGNLLQGSKPSQRLTEMLETDGSHYTWAAATTGANSAAGYQLATELPVMPIGGFNGTDPSPTLEQFQRYVADRKVHYYLGGGGGFMGGMRGGAGSSNAIREWVESRFTATEIDGVTVYDLTQPKS